MNATFRPWFLMIGALLLASCQRVYPPSNYDRVYEEIPSFVASSGPVCYKNKYFGWLNAHGSLELDHVNVSHRIFNDQSLNANNSHIGGFCIGDKVRLCGCFVYEDSEIGKEGLVYGTEIFGNLIINGSLTAQNSVFHQNVTVFGDVDAQDSCFEEELKATAEFVCMNNVAAHDVCICAIGPYTLQVVYLKNQSVIHGDIYFPSGQGRIILDATSHIEGQIYGGCIIQSSPSYPPFFY
jgi:hypothetical protein